MEAGPISDLMDHIHLFEHSVALQQSSTQRDGLVPSVSVIIPCRNEELFIARCLDSILANTYPVDRTEIIVVDGMSTDRTRDVLDRYVSRQAVIRVVDNVVGTIPVAMNLGIRASSGQIIMKVDAHSTYPPDYIAECIRYLVDWQAEMTGGIWMIMPRNDTLVAKAIAAALSHRFASGNAQIKTASGGPRWADSAAFGCWKRETLENLGLFDESLTRSSDMDLNVRLRKSGGKILLVPDIKIAYYADPDLASFWSHNFKDGLWATYSLKFGKRASCIRHWIPFALVVAILLFISLTPVNAAFFWSLVALGGMYLLASLGASIDLCLRLKTLRFLAVLPVIFAVRHFAHGLGSLYGAHLLLLPRSTGESKRARESGGSYIGKRAFDLVGSCLGGLVLLPVCVLIGLLIKADSPGPIFYRGERLGKNGRPFGLVKFRTMYWNDGRAGAPITADGDSRVTPAGSFLRRFKLDELPQLVNVLKGEMSLVGPRPEIAYYFQFYSDEEKRMIWSVRPGMTDYGSLRFHDEGALLAGSHDPVATYLERVRFSKVQEQFRYIRNQSFLTDVRIIVSTFVTILRTRCQRQEQFPSANSAQGKPVE